MSRGIKRRRSFVLRFRGRGVRFAAIRTTKGTRYDFMGAIYFVGHYFYRGKWNGQNCERVYGAVLFQSRFQRMSQRERMKFLGDGQQERGWNSKNERLLALADRRRRRRRGSMLSRSTLRTLSNLQHAQWGRFLEFFFKSLLMFLFFSFVIWKEILTKYKQSKTSLTQVQQTH